MDSSSSPPPPDSSGGYIGTELQKILIDTYVCLTAFVLFTTFVIIVTRFRLWHNNWVLKKIPELVDNPLTTLFNFCLATLPLVSYKNDLYLIWLMVLIIAYDNVLTISSGSTPGSAWILREYVNLFYTIYIGIYLNRENGNNKYYPSLMFLWSFVLVKFSLRLVFNKLVKRAYGVDNSKLVADYMKFTKHELVTSNEGTDPDEVIKGYRYLVIGEGEINVKVEEPEYIPQVEVELPDRVVTVEKVWRSKNADKRQKDICLSFAFFKLLKRRFFDYPAAEAQQEKTRQLVFDGLLKRKDNHSVYRIIRMEIGFLRDLFYTRYPATFAFGFPVFHVILLVGMVGVSLYISHKAFGAKDDTGFDYLWSKQNHNVDYRITNILLIMMILMEAFETMSYVFSDWAKVMLISQQVRGCKLQCCLYNKVLALCCKWQFSRSVNNTIGQYSLMKNYRKGCPDRLRVNCFPYSTWGWAPLKVPPRGMKEDKAVVLSLDVKKAILDSLLSMNNHPRKDYPTNGVSSLNRNGVYTDLAWTCAQSEFHTLTVWHIATGLCAIRPVEEGREKKFIEPHHSVAKHLSNYCAYLMVFQPEMLSDQSIFSVKFYFRKILSETKEFFHNATSSKKQFKKMMQVEDSGSNRVIDRAVRLAKYLMQIPDDRRWKIMADFWSEFIIFLAPSGKVREHLRMLESGGEFITHLWALLYHAGIVEIPAASNSGNYP